MNVKIESKSAFKMFGLERLISVENGQNFIDVPEFWKECFENGTAETLENVSGITVTDEYCEIWIPIKEFRFHFFYCCVCTYIVISVAASVIASTSVPSLISVVE